MSAAGAVAERDAWPFSVYPVYGRIPDVREPESLVEPRVVNSRGVEDVIDPMSFAPLPMIVMEGWFGSNFLRLKEADQRQAAAFLLNMAEEERRRACSGKRRHGESILGAFTAPQELTSNAFRRPAAECAGPLRALLLYDTSWIPVERFRDTQRVTRRLIYSYCQ